MLAILPLLLLTPLLLLIGCSTTLNRNIAATNPPIIRVRILPTIDQVALLASQPPVYRTDTDPTPRILNLPKNAPVTVAWTPGGWRVGGTTIGGGTLTIQPVAEGTVAVAQVNPANGTTGAFRPYRGHYRLVPSTTTPGKFDVVNDVDIDGYLAGVLARELYHTWNEETYKAQAIVARTYALFERNSFGQGRYWDVYADERSQVYGGIVDETEKSKRAVNDTAGIVVTYAANGQDPHIFKAYFSSCCGGISQSVNDAFGEPPIEPLQEQNNHAICNASPKFNWGPVVIGKLELLRRIRKWGAYKNRPLEANLDAITDVQILRTNEWSRPTQFYIADGHGARHVFAAEEFRSACNWDANGTGAIRDKSQPPNAPPPILFSSFVKVIADADSVRFVEGHGFGHGVGLCQWCSERRAEEGMRHEDIVLAAYPHAQLMRAY